MFKVFRLTILAVLAIVIIACSSTPSSESTGEYLDSAAVTAKVKAKLIDSLGSKAFKINVKTYKDEVQLSGFVNAYKVKQRAGDIATSVESVEKVRNNLIVK